MLNIFFPFSSLHDFHHDLFKAFLIDFMSNEQIQIEAVIQILLFEEAPCNSIETRHKENYC